MWRESTADVKNVRPEQNWEWAIAAPMRGSKVLLTVSVAA
jgi:hypothetical protein